MNLKEFFKPDWKKIIVAFIFAFSSMYLVVDSGGFGPMDSAGISRDYAYYGGAPLKYSTKTESGYYRSDISYDIAYQNLAVDLLFWYLISCLAFDKRVFKLKEENVGVYMAAFAAAYIIIDRIFFLFFIPPFLVSSLAIYKFTKNIKKSVIVASIIGILFVFLMILKGLSSALH